MKKSDSHHFNHIVSPSPLAIFHRGPDLDRGPLPSFFYFALSGEDSLNLNPFNQPVLLLDGEPVRIFSFTLPGHGEGFANKDGMGVWAKEMQGNSHLIEDFLEQCLGNIQFLIGAGYADSQHMSVGGLSRGGFIATHVAARDERVKTLLGFAPLTELSGVKEFHDLDGEGHIEALDLVQLAPKLINKNIRFYIGNHDTRVGTDSCFKFIATVAKEAYAAGVRPPQVELVINPSVGYLGHGTLRYVFEDGVKWLLKQNITTGKVET